MAVTGQSVLKPLEQQRTLIGTFVEVALVLLGGLLIAEIGQRRGVNDAVTAWAQRMAAPPALLVLLFVLGVTPFAESVTGFGVGVVLAAPVFRAFGHPPARAATVAALGLVAVPWGSLAPGILAAGRLTGLDIREIGVATAALSLPVFLVCGAAALLIAQGRAAVKAHALDLVVASVALWGGIWLANWLLGSAIAGAVGSLAGIAACLGLIRWRTTRRLPEARDMLHRGAPYGILLATLLAARGIAVLIGDVPVVSAVLASPATWLLLTSAVFARDRPDIVIPTVRRWAPVAAATVGFLLVGGLMAASGLAATLATEASGLGPGYPAFAPWLGGLGGFLTGSNVGSNAMFVVAQTQVAHQLALPTLTVVAVQNVGASLATMASAPRIALALQAAGARQDESGVLQSLLKVDAVALAAMSVLAIVLCL